MIDLVKPAPRHLAAFLLLAAALLAAVALKPAVAAAAPEQHPFIPGLSQLDLEGCGVETDSEGNLYVSNSELYAVQVFDPEGNLLTEFEAFAEDIGGIETAEPCGLAVDSEGAVYVSDFEGAVVKYAPEVFPPEEATEYLPDETAGDDGLIMPEGGMDVAVDPTDDHLYVAEFFFDAFESQIGEYEADGTLVSQTVGAGVAGARYEGVDVRWSDGRVYALNAAADEVYVFDASGSAIETTIDGTTNPNFPSGFGNNTLQSTLAIDQASGNVFVANQKENSVVSEFTASGAFVSQIGPWVGSGQAKLGSNPFVASVVVDNGAASPNQGVIYVPGQSVAPGTNFFFGVYAFADGLTPMAAPTALNSDPTSITNAAATLKATVDNKGAQSGTTCKFQVALSSSPGTPVAEPNCTRAVGGNTPEAVQANATGLTPNTAYVYRVLATNAAAGPVTATPDKGFSTLPNAPVVATNAEGTLGQTTAILNGHIDNEGAAAGSSCSFQLALSTNPTYSGMTTTVPCTVTPVTGTDSVAVTATATGLNPNTGYIYRVKAASTGGSVNGASEPFATLPNAPLVANDDPGAIAQTSIVLNGHVDNEGAAAGSACRFVIATAATPGTPVAEPACTAATVNGTANEPVTATATGLNPNTAYVYRVVATNAGGTSTGNPDKATSTLPNAPLVANDDPGAIAQTSIVLNGHVDNEGAAAGSACRFVMALAAAPVTTVAEPACSPATVNGTNNEAVTATATGLNPNTAYVYRVVATNTGGTSTATPDETAATLPNAPDASTDPVGTVERTTAVLNGHVDNEGAGAGSACSFEVTRASDPTYAAKATVPCTVTPVTGTDSVAVTATATGLNPNAGYIYRVRATSTGGSTAGADESFKTLKNVYAFTVQKVGSGSGAVSCNGAACAASYLDGTVVRLAPAPAPGSAFSGWSGGGCSGTAECVVAIGADTTVTATFDVVPPPPADATAKLPTAAKVSGGEALLEISCPGPGACRGTLKLTAKVKQGKKKKTIVVGTVPYEIPAGSTATVKVKLSAAAKKRLKKGKLEVKVGGGAVKGTITLKPGS